MEHDAPSFEYIISNITDYIIFWLLCMWVYPATNMT